MKKGTTLALALLMTLNVASMAKSPESKLTKKFEANKAAKIEKLQKKKATIEKRIACIKKAKNAKEVRQCEQKYRLVNKKQNSYKKSFSKKLKDKAQKKIK